jgi:hypothetical protein
MRTIRIQWEDGNTTVTSINGTDEEIHQYYEGQYFNLGQPHDATADRMVMAVKVEFL